jgi:transposase
LPAHKTALEKHLAGRWKDLFNASYDLLLYDLTSTYFEGAAEELPKAQRGYSRDKRGDCKQLVLALIVNAEGFPLTYEVFAGNRRDSTTLAEILGAVEAKHGKARRVWVFDRGIVTEENLQTLRQREAYYLVGTPKAQLADYEQKLLEGSWTAVSAQVEVQLVPETDEVYVLCRSAGRRAKERAMRWRSLRGLIGDLRALRRGLRAGQLKDPEKIQRRLGRLQERYPQMWKWVQVQLEGTHLSWDWDRPKALRAIRAEGAYLLRAHWTERDPAKLWATYMQLTEAEAAFRVLKSEVKIRPIRHRLPERVEAHVLVAFLGYCLWVCLKKRAARVAPSLTPWSVLDQLGRIVLVDVWFELEDGRMMRLPRITQPERAQALLLAQLGWSLPAQPPPRIYIREVGLMT